MLRCIRIHLSYPNQEKSLFKKPQILFRLLKPEMVGSSSSKASGSRAQSRGYLKHPCVGGSKASWSDQSLAVLYLQHFAKHIMCSPEEAEMIQYKPGWAARAPAEKPKKMQAWLLEILKLKFKLWPQTSCRLIITTYLAWWVQFFLSFMSNANAELLYPDKLGCSRPLSCY